MGQVGRFGRVQGCLWCAVLASPQDRSRRIHLRVELLPAVALVASYEQDGVFCGFWPIVSSIVDETQASANSEIVTLQLSCYNRWR
jgi:hypothetical protein